MSKENVQVVQKLTEAFNRRDAPLEELWHPEGEYRSLVTDIEGTGGVYRRDELSRYMDDLENLFEGWRVEDPNYIDAGDNCVVQLQRVTGRGRGSGVPIDRRIGIVWTFQDGLIILAEVFPSPQAALDAAGLSKQDAHTYGS